VVPLVLHDHTRTPSTQKWGKTNLFHNGLNPAHVPFLKVNNLNLCACCDASIRRADIEGSKSNVDMSSWLPQASYPCGNFSDTSVIKYRSIQRIVRPTFQCKHRHWVCLSKWLLPLCSKRRFCRLGATLWTLPLSFRKCAAPAKLPSNQCRLLKSA